MVDWGELYDQKMDRKKNNNAIDNSNTDIRLFYMV